jgi:hypothetical protein
MNNKMRQEILKELNLILNEQTTPLDALGLSGNVVARATQAATSAAEAAAPAVEAAAETAATKSPLTLGQLASKIKSTPSAVTQRAKVAIDFLKTRPQAGRALIQSARAARTAAAITGETTVASAFGAVAAGAVIGMAVGYGINKLMSTSFGEELKQIVEKAKNDSTYLANELKEYYKGGFHYDAEGEGTNEFWAGVGKTFGYSTGGRKERSPGSYDAKDAVIIASLLNIIYDQDLKSKLIQETLEADGSGNEIKVVSIDKSPRLIQYKDLFDKIFVNSGSVMKGKLNEYGLTSFVDVLQAAYKVAAVPASTIIPIEQKQTFQNGNKVQYKDNPNLGTYTVSDVSSDGKTMTISAGGKLEKADTSEYILAKESLRSKIIKEINKILNEGPPNIPGEKSAPVAPTPAATAPTPAPAATAPTTATSWFNNFLDPNKSTSNTTSASPNLDASVTKATVQGESIRCADPKLIVIEQQYLKYVKGYKEIAVDGIYGGETHGYLRRALGVKDEFAKVLNNPDSICKFIVDPNGLAKSASVNSFDELKQLIQSKMPKGEIVGIVPKITTKSVKANTNPYKNYRIYTFSALPQNIKDMLKTTYGGNTDAATVRNRLNGPGWILSLNDEKNTLIDIRQDIGKALDSFSGLKESWSIRNKNKYTENLFERLITSINNGENK